MNSLPRGWHLVSLGDVVRKVENNIESPDESEYERFIKVEHLDADSLKIRRWGLIAEEALPPTFRKVFRAGQILYPTRNPHLRRTAYADFDGICGEKTLTLEPNEGLAEELFPFIFQREDLIQHATSMMIGSTNPHIRWRDLAAFQFPLPPLDEQRRIAEILWAVEEAIETWCTTIEDTRILRRVSYLQWANGNQVHTWPWVELGDICRIQNGQVDPTKKPYSSMVHIAPDDIESETGKILERNTAAQDRVTSGKYLFEPGCILYSKIRPNLMKVAIPDFGGVCSADMYPIYPRGNVLTRFLYRLLLTPEFTAYASASSVRSAIPKINRNSLLSYRLQLPPMSEQQLLVDAQDAIEHAQSILENHVEGLIQLKQGLLLNLLGTTFEPTNVQRT